jgi:AAA domain
MRVGPVEVTSQEDTPKRMAVLLWGSAGCGKTTFSATAPGKKLWLSFGDQEHVSVSHRKDVLVANLSELGYEELFKHGQTDNPFGLDQILAGDSSIHTVVCDSVTAIAFRALQKAVGMRLGASREFTPTMEQPGLSAYGGRNAIVLEVLTGLLRITAKHGVHIIITAHEADPVLNKDGTVQYITIMLGGKLVNNNTWRLSEIWYMSEDGDRRRLAVRPTRLRRPMKTRMFTGKGQAEFELLYDADKDDKGQMTIKSMYDQWVMSQGKIAIPLPRQRK